MLDKQQVLDRYFPETRAWLIQIAAVLDRHDRAAGNTEGDERLTNFQKSLEVLADPQAEDRAERIQRIFSDPID